MTSLAKLSALTLVAFISRPLYAQMGAVGTGAQSSSRATQLPPSGRSGNSGSVSASQSANPGEGITSVNSSVQVTGNLAGSTPLTSVPAGPIRLTMQDALKYGLEANLGTVSADLSVRAARAQRLQQLSALLPNISANLSETVAQVNLAAYGFQFTPPPGSNFSIPTVVGPYTYSQAQGQLSQSIIDITQRRNWKASKETERASVLNAKDTRELVVMAVGGTYLQVIASAARLESQRAQVESSRAVYEQANVRKQAGVNARIDVVRSLVEYQTQQQRLSSYEADLAKQKINLARIIGLPLDREVILAETLHPGTETIPDVSQSISHALSARWDLQAASAQVRAAELALSAAHGERYPTASVNGNYGVIGPNPASTHGVFTVTGSVNIPIYQGGRVRGEIQEAEATLKQRQAELSDQRGRVESEVRTAQIELQTALTQAKVAETNRGFARETLEEARDRFSAGVATTVEVVQAQEQLASAENDYVSTLYSLHLARLSLARSTGSAEAALPTLLKGNGNEQQ